MRLCCTLVWVGFACAFAASRVTAAFIIDQHNDSAPPTIGWNVANLAPMQSFTPTLSTISYVELYMEHTHRSGEPVGLAFARIRQSTRNGPIVATSSTLLVTQSRAGFVHFD